MILPGTELSCPEGLRLDGTSILLLSVGPSDAGVALGLADVRLRVIVDVETMGCFCPEAARKRNQGADLKREADDRLRHSSTQTGIE